MSHDGPSNTLVLELCNARYVIQEVRSCFICTSSVGRFCNAGWQPVWESDVRETISYMKSNCRGLGLMVTRHSIQTSKK